MSKSTDPNDNYRIAAMQKKQVMGEDLMVSGSGIPWEDRGSVGLAGGFIKTVIGIMFSPVKTLAKMRRPETMGDSNSFAYICAGIWAIASAVQSLVAYRLYSNNPDLQPSQYWENTALEAVGVGLLMAVLPRILGMLFYKLTSFDMATKAPPVLINNLVNYLMAPSVLAVIPGGPNVYLQIGPALAAIWFFVILTVVAIKHLRVKAGAAIIGAFVTTFAGLTIVAAVYLVIWLVWIHLLGFDPITPPPPTQQPG
jgi:hypothetical protein